MADPEFDSFFDSIDLSGFTDGVDISHCVVGHQLHEEKPNLTAEPLPSWIARLEDASSHGDIAAVRSIFTSERLPSLPSERHYDDVAYSLFLAVKHNRVPVAAYLLSQGIPIQKRLLELAVEQKSYPLLQLFLDSGWCINEPLSRDTPPALTKACQDKDLCRWFLSHDADPNVESTLGTSPLSIAVYEAPFDVIQLLFEHGGSTKYGQLIIHAARRELPDAVDVVKLVLDNGACVNHIMFEDRQYAYLFWESFGVGTALHEAARVGSLGVLELLLERGANPMVKDSKGRLAIDLGEYYGHTAIVGRLRPLSGRDDQMDIEGGPEIQRLERL